ncbi:MAG: hypothetical protein UT41_C0003G0011 [Candidatus Wolfebacteria bacterium GW2011_GWC2_39_22]|uniref:Uncharacterized protein n=1 Tax=Candidatus Wolfebacteria bacterium GW2011_GWC2_39_22 TaxID=1619013 RepID=A0A0G0N7H3_9BACT|nr:MAG: hypothetical protein UT41_C0003G0011 [Candidatus Wolfebacteria bacterium GW2011_GWC2_39_22]HBI25311.1 hypothetical protein [Candidatus Wolfebacteria bacterium]
MPEEEIKQKTIGLAETIFVVLLVGTEEFFEFLILVITLGTGIIVTEPMNLATGLAIEAYMLLRGGRGVMKLIVQPIGTSINAATANLAPGKTVALVAGIWIINNPDKMEKVMGAIAKVTGQAIQIGATVFGGVAGGAAAKVAGGMATKIATRKFTGATVTKVEQKGVSAARQRMASANRASEAGVMGAKRMEKSATQEQEITRYDGKEGNLQQEVA